MIKSRGGEVESVPIRVKKARTDSLAAKKQPIIPKKVAGTVIPQRKSSRRTLPTDLLGKKIIVSDDAELDRKIEIVEKISTNKHAQKSTYVQVGTPSLAEFKTRINLALMAPFKFDINHNQLASNVARYVGTAFVIVGGFFTLFNMSALSVYIGNTNHALSAQTISSCESGTLCTSGVGSTTPNVTASQTPLADIAVEVSGTTLTNTLPINVTVPLATRVDLVAHNRSTNQSQSIGTMSRVSDLTWRTYWQTLAFEDGEYTLKAVVTNQYGSYTSTKDAVFTILNHPVDQTASAEGGSTPTSATSTPSTTTTTSTEATTITTEQPLVQQLPAVRVELGMSAPLHGDVTITTRVGNATMVKHFIRQSGTAQSTPIGTATLRSTGEWKYLLMTAILPDGNYDITTQALFSNGTSNTKVLERVAVKHATSTETLATTTPPNVALQPQPVVTDTEELAPTIQLKLASVDPLSGYADAYVTVTGASFVEIYAQPDGALVPRFVGLATRQSDSNWRLRFNTTLIPNGKYLIFARVRHAYGDSESTKVEARIANVVEETISQQNSDYLNTLKTAITESEKILQDVSTELPPKVESTSEVQTEDVAPRISTFEATYAIEDDIGDEYTHAVDDVLKEFMNDLNETMREYSRAIRNDDTEKAQASLAKLTSLREEIIRKLPFEEDNSDILRKINIHIETIIKGVRDRTERSEAILKERIGDDVKRDSDSDSVSDYDEINLYKTDPFSADSDKDGFIDGVEILNGYDPKDSKREANIQYESPREQGMLREDLFTVETITTVSDNESDSENIQAHIGGKALPNSFVTLYVFSTPIIVTVKTDAEGNWSYIFDKELEDGEHEVYVGITDNAGKIVAKSNPLAFIKTAQAFTPVDASETNATPVTPPEPALIDQKVLFVVGSIAIVALGLVLILIGLHVKPRDEEPQFA